MNVLSIKQEFCAPGCVSVDCADPGRFVRHTDQSVYKMADNIKDLHDRNMKSAKEKMCKEYGVNYVENGLLYDQAVRKHFLPVTHQLRDWMHIICSGGVANTEIGLLIQLLFKVGVSLETMQNFIESVTLPHKHGKVRREWLSHKRIQDDNLKSYASIILSLAPIMLLFMTTVLPLEVRGMFKDHILCLRILRDIIGLLSLGAVDAVPHVETLRTLIKLHAELFNKLYPLAAKPKFHHLFHIVDNVIYLERLLSCFVTERKHRASKKSALHVYRHMEHTVLADMLNQFCNSMSTDVLFRRTALVRAKKHPMPNTAGQTFYTAKSALLSCGEVDTGDVVYLTDHTIGKVLQFWQRHADDGAEIVVELEALPRKTPGTTNVVFSSSRTTIFENAEAIIDACPWIKACEESILVLEPFVARDLASVLR